jgi:hypothetical protein
MGDRRRGLRRPLQVRLLSLPWQQVMEPALWPTGDAGENVSHVNRLRIVDHPSGSGDEAPRLEARSEAERRKA